jgi:hypothetical protein
MAGLLDDDAKAEIASELLERLRAAAPPGMLLLDARLVAPGEKTLGELVAGADFAVDVEPEQLDGLAARVSELLAGGELVITRAQRLKKKRNGKRRDVGSKDVSIELRDRLLFAEVDAARGRLRFRLRTDLGGANARPREIAGLLLGADVEDHRMRRERLLARATPDGELIGLRELGSVLRPAHRRHPLLSRERVAESPPPA